MKLILKFASQEWKIRCGDQNWQVKFSQNMEWELNGFYFRIFLVYVISFFFWGEFETKNTMHELWYLETIASQNWKRLLIIMQNESNKVMIKVNATTPDIPQYRAYPDLSCHLTTVQTCYCIFSCQLAGQFTQGGAKPIVLNCIINGGF